MLATNSAHRGTISAKFPFYDDEAADLLAKLLTSKTDASKTQIFHILTQINNTQRQMIKTPYKIKYKKDLMIDLMNGLSDDYRDIILALMETPTKYDTLQLVKAINGTSINESVLIEILCLRTSMELSAIKNEYQIILGNKLENDIATRVSGDLKDILLIVIQKPIIATNDNSSSSTDMEKIKQEVKKILGEKKKIDKTAMKIIVGSLPTYQLNTLTVEYATIAGRQIEQDIEKYFNGPAKKALLALIQYARNSNSYFADLLNSSLKNPSETRDGDLIRLIISRSEIDLATISEAYMKSYKKKLIEDINKECNDFHATLWQLTKNSIQQSSAECLRFLSKPSDWFDENNPQISRKRIVHQIHLANPSGLAEKHLLISLAVNTDKNFGMSRTLD
uniref:Bm10655 n=1 Tax=Brugia malayi TaxID=6279 RepID=A0A0H5S9P4_BRUMA|nr:Bm10655 [Brugia malayi]